MFRGEGRTRNRTRAGTAAAADITPVTSENSPFKVSWITDGLGCCACPGKRVDKPRPRAGHEESSKRPIRRNLAADLATLAAVHKVTMVVCLLNDAELRSLGVSSKDYPTIAADAGIELVTFPVIEGGVGQGGMEATHAVLAAAHNEVALRGGRAVLHCRGGVGRAGMLAACFLLLAKVCKGAQKAIKHVNDSSPASTE
eukprot:gene5743-35512_t